MAMQNFAGNKPKPVVKPTAPKVTPPANLLNKLQQATTGAASSAAVEKAVTQIISQAVASKTITPVVAQAIVAHAVTTNAITPAAAHTITQSVIPTAISTTKPATVATAAGSDVNPPATLLKKLQSPVPEVIKEPTPGTVGYVGSQLQTISPSGTIQAPPISLSNPAPISTSDGIKGGTPDPVGSPGKAWVWSGTQWTKPTQTDPKTVWDDANGWVAGSGNSAGGTGTALTTEQINKMISDGIAAGLKGLNTTQSQDKNPDYVAAITSLLGSYGIGDLSNSVVAAVQKGFTPDTINLIMQDPTSSDPLALAFQKRFPANELLFKAGKAVLSPAQYLNQEKSYATTFQAYGLSQYATPDKFTDLIAKDVSPSELNSRILLGVDRVQNADQATKDALKQFYPALNQSDILAAVTDPNQGLPDLQHKIQVAEIGGAALAQHLEASATADKATMGAGALADLGITKQQAQTGYGNIASYLPTAQKLSDIYGKQTDGYGQVQAEGDVFQNLASSQRARESLNKLEGGTFTGSSGTLGPSYGTPRSSFNDLTPGQI